MTDLEPSSTMSSLEVIRKSNQHHPQLFLQPQPQQQLPENSLKRHSEQTTTSELSRGGNQHRLQYFLLKQQKQLQHL